MDGSYGNVFPTSRAIPPNAPAPSGNQYKVNVNRQKTKKWANFKPQNYDGDDWGSDYDEPAHEPEPPLPPKPLGPRQPGAHSPTTRPFQPVGSPPLRTHTQQYTGPSSARPGQAPTFTGSPSVPVGPPRRVTEPFGPSPHHHTQGHAQPQFSSDAARAYPSPHSPHPLPSQLPPSKGSIGPNDGANTLEAVRQSSASPWTVDNSKPWMDSRSASPRSAGPMASPTKPLPFIRPADVYQRMEEERARGSQPLDAGRPTADTAGGPAVSEMRSQGIAPPRSGGSPAAGDFNTTRPREPASGPTPVAERQSVYGMEGFLASYGGEGPSAEAPASSEQVQSAAPQKSVEPLSPVNIRRFSTSPQLPDLSRMSGFGEDLFSSSFFPASGLRSPVSDSMPLSTVGEDVPDSTAAGADAPNQSAAIVTPQSMASNTAKDGDSASLEKGSPLGSSVGGGADASSFRANEPDEGQPAVLSPHQAAAQPVLHVAEQQAPAEDAAREPASRNEERPAADTLSVRPHLPGGWVSETPSTPAEGATSPAVGPAQETPDKASEAEGRPNTDAQPEVAPLNANAPGSRQSEPEAGVASEAGEGENSPVPLPLHPISPQSRSPLGKSSPTPTGELDMSSQQAPSEVEARKDSPSPEGRGTSERSEITPTAPLNPRRGTPDSHSATQPVLSPPPLATGPKLDTEAHSPVKDSDKLSEEIMKSLSPMQPDSELSDKAEGSTAAYHAAAADPTRESSYLGDVYGDYWAATEDKAEPGLLTLGKTVDAQKTRPDPSPAPVKAPEGPTVPSDMAGSSSTPATSDAVAKVPSPQPENAAGAGLQRRFSWEALPEEATPTTVSSPGLILSPPSEQLVEQKAFGSGVDNMAPSAGKLGGSKTEPSQPSPGLEVAKSLEDLRAESAPELNLAATLSPTPAPDRQIQPSPPISELTDSQGGDKGPSLADEKIVLQNPSHSATTPPPLEQHPVFAAQTQRPPPKDELPSVPSPKNMNIIGFRTIMEMPSPAERIRHYAETRWQFATVDTGLDEWLRAMLAGHPEHANAGWSFQAAAPHAQQGGGGQGGAVQVAHGSGQGLRSPAHLHMPHLQHGLSGLGHSSGQVGTKSKELLMAAGKAGKGLFSKGRNKLRGTNS